jgi:hypothetical protein
MKSFAWIFPVVAACGGVTAPEDTHVDFDTRILFTRGVAGDETLFALGAAGELPLSTAGGTALCEGHAFCDFPPNDSYSRFPLYALAGNRAVFLDADPFDARNNVIYSVDLVTGARVTVSGGVHWAALSDSRPAWSYALAVVSGTTYWSLATTSGAELFRATDAAGPVASIATLALPGSTFVAEAKLAATDAAVAWSIERSDFSRQDVLLDAAGTVRFDSAHDLPAGSIQCHGALLAGTTYAIGFSAEPNCPRETTWVIDTRTFAKRVIEKSSDSVTQMLSHDGTWLYERGQDGAADVTIAYDLTRSAHEQVRGRPVEASPVAGDIVVTRDGPGVTGRITLADVSSGTRQELAGAGLGDSPYSGQRDIFFTEDGAAVVTLTGDASPDLCANTGLQIWQPPAAPFEIAARHCDDAKLRLPAPAASGDDVLYLDDEGNLVATSAATHETRALAQAVRAFRVFAVPRGAR